MTDDPYAGTEFRSCSSHCCKNHGCKYGHKDCPVTTGAVEQEYLCEYCTYDLEEAEIYTFGMAATTVTVGYSRGDDSIKDLPDQAVVDRAIAEALQGLEVAPGWTIRVVVE